MPGLEYREADIRTLMGVHSEMHVYHTVCFLHRVTGLPHSCYPRLRRRSWEPEGDIWPREGDSESLCKVSLITALTLISWDYLNLQMSLPLRSKKAPWPPLQCSWELFAFNLLLPSRSQTLTLMPSCFSHLLLSCRWIPTGPYWLCPKGSLRAPLPARVNVHFFHNIFVVCLFCEKLF